MSSGEENIPPPRLNRLKSEKVTYSVLENGKPCDTWSLKVNTSDDGETEEVITIKPKRTEEVFGIKSSKRKANDSEEEEEDKEEETSASSCRRYRKVRSVKSKPTIYQEYGEVVEGDEKKLSAYAYVPNDGKKYDWLLKERKKGVACSNREFSLLPHNLVERYREISKDIDRQRMTTYKEIFRVCEDDAHTLFGVNKLGGRLHCNLFDIK